MIKSIKVTKKMPAFIVEVEQGALVPRGYGVYRYDYASCRAWACWLPFNVLVAACLWLYWRMVIPRSLLESRRAEIAELKREYCRSQDLLDESAHKFALLALENHKRKNQFANEFFYCQF